MAPGHVARAMAAALLAALVLGSATRTAAELYRWSDADGVVHYTADRESIPPARRSDARAIPHPAPRPGAPPAAASPGAVPPEPPLVARFAAGAPIVVPASLNGVALNLVLDTGADRTMLSPEALARAGLSAEAGRPVQVVGVTGSAGAVVIAVPRLDLAGVRVGPLAVVAHPSPIDGVDGLLGRDVLDAFVLTVDAASARAILTPR